MSNLARRRGRARVAGGLVGAAGFVLSAGAWYADTTRVLTPDGYAVTDATLGTAVVDSTASAGASLPTVITNGVILVGP